MRNFCYKNLYTIFSLALFLWASVAYGEAMTGAVYKMDSDSLNFAGDRSTSETYYLNDTLGETATGDSSGTTYKINAGFLQTDDASTISVSVSDNFVTLLPSLGGISGGYSNASTTANVITDNSAGYSIYIKSETGPALESTLDSFADYVPAGAVPDYEYSVSLNQSNFGFSPEGTYIDSRYKDDGTDCGTGSLDTSLKCWDGFSTTDMIIGGRGSVSSPEGDDTKINFRAGIGANKMQTPGWYCATTTITVVAL